MNILHGETIAVSSKHDAEMKMPTSTKELTQSENIQWQYFTLEAVGLLIQDFRQ